MDSRWRTTCCRTASMLRSWCLTQFCLHLHVYLLRYVFFWAGVIYISFCLTVPKVVHTCKMMLNRDAFEQNWFEFESMFCLNEQNLNWRSNPVWVWGFANIVTLEFFFFCDSYFFLFFFYSGLPFFFFSVIVYQLIESNSNLSWSF